MKILVVSAYFYPDITPRSFRTTELVKEFVREGHDVTVCLPCRKFDYSSFVNQFPCRIQFIPFNHQDKSIRGDSLISKIFRKLQGIINWYTLYPEIGYYTAISKVLKQQDRTDLLISIAAPHTIHWGVDKFLRHHKNFTKRWIADCGDPFMGNQVSTPPFYFSRFEKKFCSRADYISVPISAAITAYYPEFRHKITIIPQGFDLTENYKKNSVNVIPTFAYAGVLYKGYRDLNSFIDYLADCHSTTKYKFILYTGSSLLTERYKKQLQDKIEIRGVVQRDTLLQQLANMDFLVNIENKGTAQSPSKLIDYAIVARPILSVSNVCNTRIIDQFLAGNYSGQMHLPDISQYDIRNVAKQFLSLM